MLKRISIFAVALCVLFLGACKDKEQAPKQDGKLNIVATIYPLYDFARATAKEQANIKMLAPPGSSIHAYEPTPADIESIQNADVFLYIGGENDAWVDRILSALDTSKMEIVKFFDFVKLYEEEILEEGEEEAEYDEHIWTSPKNAVIMIDRIAETLCKKDSQNCNAYKENSKKYTDEINTVSEEIRQVINSASKKLIVIADRFPFLYFTKEYGLDFVAAFAGCSDQTDASPATIANLIKTVKDNNIPYIYYVELSNKNTAQIVAEQTGAKMLLLHSSHNLSKQEFEQGITYLDLLKQNTENLKIGFLEK